MSPKVILLVEIRKPVDVEQCVLAIHRLGLSWLLLNEPPPARGEQP